MIKNAGLARSQRFFPAGAGEEMGIIVSPPYGRGDIARNEQSKQLEQPLSANQETGRL